MEEQLISAANEGRVEEVETLLRNNPDLNVNGSSWKGWAALHHSCENGHIELVKLLLAHPVINVNLQLRSGATPLAHCCASGDITLVRLLLKDPRVYASLADHLGRTPLWKASCSGHVGIIEWLIASGRDLGILRRKWKIPGITCSWKWWRYWKDLEPIQFKLAMTCR